MIWKAKAGKQLPIPVARELIKTGRTEKPVSGFKGRSGRSFRARLALEQGEDGKWRVEFDEEWATAAPPPPPEQDGAAPAKPSSDGGRKRRRSRAASVAEE